MVVIFASFYPKKDQVDQNKVKEILENMIQPTRSEKGNSKYDLFLSKNDNNEHTYHLFEIYENQAAVDYHRTTNHYINYRKEIIKYIDKPIEVKILEQVK